MRYFDIQIESDLGGIHPVDAALASAEGQTRRALLHIDAFGDGSGILFYECQGDPDAAVEAVADHDRLISYDVLGGPGEEFHLYLYVHPGEPAGSLIALTQRYALMIETPIEFTDDGVLVTVVGRHDMLREALTELPASIDVAIEQVGEYSPDGRDALSLLTDRQREVFETAVGEGYYEIPREVNQEQLADELDCAPSTVDEHLRKAESKLLSAVMHAPSARSPGVEGE